MQATVFQAEVYDILACVYGLQMNATPEKYVNTGSDSQAALQALQAAKQCLHWYIQRCQKVFNDISTQYIVGVYWVPGHARE